MYLLQEIIITELGFAKHKLIYSSVPNKRVGWNKRVGRKIYENLINVLDGISVLVGIFEKINKHFGGEISKIVLIS